ncbi:MAG: DUF2798 domain-containing protein [Oscillospiraceae bacterium]|nr:DUF2798 domain-containing protein [Oscillospiraceae bacterium]
MSEKMRMPENRREELIFTVMCVLFMCSVMLTYNMIMALGFTFAAVQMTCMLFPLTCVVCFCLDFFVACPVSGFLMRKVAGPWITKPWMGTVLFQLFTVTQIVILESFYGALIEQGFTSGVWMSWLHHMPLNAMVAYPVMILVCSPIVRFLFRLLIPVGQLKCKKGLPQNASPEREQPVA